MPIETEAKIIALVQDMKNTQDVTAETALIDSGLLDSFDVITLMIQLEEAFGILIPGDQIIPENLGNVQDIARLVESQKS